MRASPTRTPPRRKSERRSLAGSEVLYYVTGPGTAGTNDIYRAEKNGGTWEATAQRMGPFDETHPVVTDDDMVSNGSLARAAGEPSEPTDQKAAQ